MNKETQIKVTTYEEERLNYFIDLMQKQKKSYDRLYKRFQNSPYLFDGTTLISDAGRELSFCEDVVAMLKQGYRKQKEGEWIEHPHFDFEGGYSGANYECSNCHYDDCYEETPFCPNCGAKMKGGAE